eukprot:CAMPEP_0198255548 /NCGR_PEP_ID=MMETSP1447-20131203/5645_1 /TAXON_ID=420782 /ORGANISM="Chaetoceros dichaeta, Strain CCMP1751" /LENGTH=616 /DNA_ID=CAMNT_0043941941 /DNA_START=113 /DNA_END=1963 /DNA_ORIENTATION=+
MISLTRSSRIYCCSLLLLLDYTAVEANVQRAIERQSQNLRDLKLRNDSNNYSNSKNNNADDTRNLSEEVENCWMQLGTDLDGERVSDSFGASVDLSSIVVRETDDDSSHISIAVGGYGYARMFDYTVFGPNDDGNTTTNNTNNNNIIYDGEWIPLGERIEGDKLYDEFGHATSLSANGRIVAFGAPSHDNNTDAEDGADETHGLVKVYTYTTASKSWSQLGQDIGGFGRRFGHSVALSDDGHTVICGTDFLGINPSKTRVFRYDETDQTWNLLGEPITGKIEADGSGFSTSISSDGSIVAIGAVTTSVTRVYTFTPPNSSSSSNTTTGTWTQMGTDIVGEQSDDKSGTSVSLTPDGMALAIGARGNDGNQSKDPNAGHVRIYTFNNATKDWVKMGQDIDGEDHSDNSGAWVSLSADAHTVAIGAWANDGNGPTAGHARVYRYNESNDGWTQYGQDIDGVVGNDAFGAALSLSPDGSILAIASRAHNSQEGHVRVFANTKETCTITLVPSAQPTSSPSQAHSVHPSSAPSRFPSYLPSASPVPSQVPDVIFQSPVAATKSPTKPPSPLLATPPSPSPQADNGRGITVPPTPNGAAASTREVFILVASVVVGVITIAM